MEKKRKAGWRGIVSLLLLLCLILPDVPGTVYPAEAAGGTNLITPENARGRIRNGIYQLSDYQLMDNGDLVLTNTYHYTPGPLMTYYTVDTIWSRNSTREDGRKFGYPELSGTEGTDWVRTGVSAEDTPAGAGGSKSTYTYSQTKIKSILRQLFGELQADTDYTVYMSEIFVLKQRYADGSSKLYSKEYKNIDDIRNAVSWTNTTREQFEAYYDIPLTFRLQGGTLNVICVDMDYGYSIIDGAGYSEKLVLGENKVVVPKPKIMNGEDVLTYAGCYNISYNSDNCTLEKEGGPGRITMTSPETINVYLGYHRVLPTPTPAPTPEPGVSVTPTPVPTVTPKPGTSYDRIDRFYTTEEGYVLDGIANQDRPGYGNYRLAAQSGAPYLKDNPVTKREQDYAAGTDSSGNKWYFRKEGDNAVEVHPYIYKGKDAGTAEGIREITELTFPSTLKYGGRTYTVVSIGGGGATYHKDSDDYSGNPFTGMSRSQAYRSYKGEWSLYNPYSSHNESTGVCVDQVNTEWASYWYGVAGNGAIESGRIKEYTSYNMYAWYVPVVYSAENHFYNYYVYNTTLRSITIPDTVTAIMDYAFCYCQKLEEINGGANVETIGDYAFMGVPTAAAAVMESGETNTGRMPELEHMMKAEVSVQKTYEGKPWKTEYYYNENINYTGITAEMKEWEGQIVLGGGWGFPEPSQMPELRALGTRAFAFHTNLKDVVLSGQVSSIGTECFGYDKLEEITVENDTVSIGQHYQTLGTHGMLTATDDPRTLVRTPEAGTAAGYVDTYSSWYTMDGKKEIELNGWSPDIHTDRTVEVEEDGYCRDVVPPIKYGYEFKGYYTEPEGKGTKYFDEDGKCIKKWEEDPGTDELYARWEPVQAPPVTGEIPEETPDDEETAHVIIRKEGSLVRMYADDYNDATGALTDMQPYLTDDLYVDGVKVSGGGIPSTEQVAVRGKTGAWMYDVTLRKVTGTANVSVRVNVPYEITYQDDEGVRKESTGSCPVTITVPKAYSYWVVDDVVRYLADKVTVNNAVLAGGSVTIPVDWDVENAPAVTEPVIVHSHKVRVPGTGATVDYQGTYRDTYGKYEDIDWDWVEQQCTNMAMGCWHYAGEPCVTNDRLVIDGVVVLDNTETDGEGLRPDEASVSGIRDIIPDTDYTQIYVSGVELEEDAANASYGSVARYEYISADGTKTFIAGPEETVVNNIRIHTPVVCDGMITVNGTEYGRYEDGDFHNGMKVDFPIRQAFTPFTVQIGNYGLHRLLLGYGERDFGLAKDGSSNIVSNEVRFPFGVYYDTMDDSFSPEGELSYAGDRYFPAGTWIKVGNAAPGFYVAGLLSPGEYTVEYRSTAVNCPKDADGNYSYHGNGQRNANLDTGKYVATDSIILDVHEDFMEFGLTGTNDPSALEDFLNGQQMLTLDRGYFFSFRTRTVGHRFNSNSMGVEITPSYTFISEDGKQRTGAALYYNESINGKSEYFVKVGNVKDLSNIHSYTNRDELPGVPEARLGYTEGILGEKIAGKKTDLFAFGGKIMSDRWLRMYTPAGLLPDRYCRECYIVYSGMETRPCSHTSAAGIIFQAESMKSIVQEWYGGLYLPADTFCVTADTMEGYCDSCGKTRYVTGGRTTCPEHGTALKVSAGGAAGVIPFSFSAYAAGNTLTGEEEFFRKDGYIAVNFEIRAADGAYSRTYVDYDSTGIAQQWKESGIPYRTGDVVLYRLDKSIRDAYEIGGSE